MPSETTALVGHPRRVPLRHSPRPRPLLLSLLPPPSRTKYACSQSNPSTSPFTRVSIALPEKKAKFYERPSRHHSVDLRYCTRHFRRTFSFFVTVTLVIVRFKIRLVKKQKQVEVEVEVEVMSCIEPRGSPSCAHAVFPTGPLVVRRFSACRFDEYRYRYDTDLSVVLF